MSAVDFNVLGRQSGKVGPVVGYVRAGVNMFRAYVKKVRVAKDEESLVRRAKFAALVKLAQGFYPALNIGYKSKAKGTLKNTSNIFVSKNYEAITATDPDTIIVDYGALHVSEGRGPNVEFKTTNFTEEAEVSVTFEARTTMPGQQENDKVYVFVYQPDMAVGIMSLPASRSAGSITVPVPANFSGMQVHLYGFCCSAGLEASDTNAAIARNEPSPSTYIGDGTIA